MSGAKGRSGGQRRGAGPHHKGVIEWQVSGVYTEAHYAQFPPDRFGSGTYLVFKDDEEDAAREQVRLWLQDPRFDFVCLFKQRTIPRTDLVQQLSREVFGTEANRERLYG